MLASAEKRSGVAVPGYAGQASHIEGARCQADFFSQSSELITYLFTSTLNTDS